MTIALPAALCAAAPPPTSVPVAAPAVPAGDPASAKKDKSVQMDKSKSSTAPDAALLDYIGRYGEAVIGLDPLGLAADAAAGAPDKEQ